MGLSRKANFHVPVCQSIVFRYAIFATICVIFLFLGAMYCFNSCQLTACEDAHCNSVRYSGGDARWISSIFSMQAARKPKISAFLVVLILSSAENMERRVTIRQTWLKDIRSDVLHLFVIGTSILDDDEKRTLKSEISRFQDIIFLSEVNDTYSSLTQKLQHGLSWVHENVDFSFLFKCDDDTFARIDDMVSELESLAVKDKLYWGFFNGRAHVHRRGRWFENEYVLCDYFVPYALGGGYVVSADIVHYVAVNKEYLKLYNSEDVSLGTWLAPINVRRLHDTRFDTEYLSRGCFNSYLVTHKQSVDQMREKYWLLQEKGRLCATEQRTRLSYEYNWKVPPSQCCIRNNSKIP